jgi:hypothetical protein
MGNAPASSQMFSLVSVLKNSRASASLLAWTTGGTPPYSSALPSEYSPPSPSLSLCCTFFLFLFVGGSWYWFAIVRAMRDCLGGEAWEVDALGRWCGGICPTGNR